jgi:hypothetical protein
MAVALLITRTAAGLDRRYLHHKALSVILQVGSYQLFGKDPACGYSSPFRTARGRAQGRNRFWILAIIFALSAF